MSRLATIVLTMSLLASSFAAAADSSGPSPAAEVVTSLQNALLDAMKQGSKLDVNARYEKLAPVISRAYDFAYVTPRVFGSGWQQLNDQQKQTLSELYQRSSIMMYAREFSDYHGEQFVMLSDADDKRGGRFVRTEMRVPGSQSVHFDYLLHQKDDRWSIVNTTYDGVSGLSMDRTRYEPLLRAQGPDAVISELRKAANAAAPAQERPR